MLDGKKHEELLAEYNAFERRMQDEGDRNTARIERRIQRDHKTVYDIQMRIRELELGLKRQQTDTAYLINSKRGDLNDERDKVQREMRKLSILMDPQKIKLNRESNGIHWSKWIAVQGFTATNTKPVNCVDLDIVFNRVYDLTTMKVSRDSSYNRTLFSKSFKTEADAWGYYDRNKDKIYRDHVAWIIGDESEMDIDVDPGEEFDRLFDFRLIYQQGYYNTHNDDTRGPTEHRYRSFRYDINGNRQIVVNKIEKETMQVSVVERDWKTGEITTAFSCTLRYLGNQCIEVTCPEGRTEDGKTCFEEINDAITKGPTDQVCVDQRTFFQIKHIRR